jgi:hypothetical protein
VRVDEALNLDEGILAAGAIAERHHVAGDVADPLAGPETEAGLLAQARGGLERVARAEGKVIDVNVHRDLPSVVLTRAAVSR